MNNYFSNFIQLTSFKQISKPPLENLDKVKYKTFIKKSLQNIGFNVSQLKVEKSIDEIIHFQTKLNHIMTSSKDNDHEKLYNFKYLNGLQTNKINFKLFLSQTFQSIQDSDYVVFRNIAYFNEFEKLINTTSSSVINDILLWSSFLKIAPFYNKRQAYIWQTYKKQKATYRYKNKVSCILIIEKIMPIAVSAAYLSELNIKKLDAFGYSVFNKLVNSTKLGILKSKWINEYIKQKLFQHLNQTEYIDINSYYNNSKTLDNYYGKLFFTGRENFIEFYYKTNQYYQKKFIYNFDHNIFDANYYHKKDYEVNAFYRILENLIKINFGISRFIYDKIDIRSIFYGSIGFIVGHEFAHAVHYFDNDRKIATENTTHYRAFNTEKLKREKCIVDQYSKHDVGGQKLDGKLTLIENIADLAGIKYAYMAMELDIETTKLYHSLINFESFTPEKMFFISLAQNFCNSDSIELDESEHSPKSIRINGATSNFDKFSTAFGCSASKKMNLTNKCE
ncbi:hypothetical protein A3Q56_03524, partial [Intoshia linei]